jgi:hypothetical protein
MRKKKLIFILMIVLVLTTSVACLSFGTELVEDIVEEVQDIAEEVEDIAEPDEEEEVTSPAEVTEEAESDDTGGFQELVMLENNVWIQEETTVFISFFFENPNSDIIFEDVDYNVYIYDANGNEIGSDYSFVRWIFPNQTFGIVFNYYLSEDDPAVDSVSIEWEYEDTIEPNGFTYPFTIDDAVYWPDEYYPMVTGRIINNDPETYTEIRVNVICYNSAGSIVGGGYSYLDFIPGDDYMGFIDYVDTFDEVASVEVYPTFTYSSEYIESNDFWSDITILDDYFYEGPYSGVYGGVIIQNNTEYPLEDSIVYVTFYDDAGHVTTTGYTDVDILLPGDEVGVSPWVTSLPEGAVTTEYDVLVLPGERLTDYELMENPFTVTSANVTGDYDNYVTATVANNYGKGVSEIDVYVLIYNADGQIIGGGYDWSEAIPAYGSTEVEIWVSYSTDEVPDSFDVWAEPSYWTEFE